MWMIMLCWSRCWLNKPTRWAKLSAASCTCVTPRNVCTCWDIRCSVEGYSHVFTLNYVTQISDYLTRSLVTFSLMSVETNGTSSLLVPISSWCEFISSNCTMSVSAIWLLLQKLCDICVCYTAVTAEVMWYMCLLHSCYYCRSHVMYVSATWLLL